MGNKTHRLWEILPRVAKYAVITVLMALPIVALGRLMISTEEELEDVRGQALLEFKNETRVLTDMWQHHLNTGYSWGVAHLDSHRGNLTYEACSLKLNGKIILDDVRMESMGVGYYNQQGDLSPGTPLSTIDWDIYLRTVTFGHGNYPILINGLRLEFARRPADGAFLFFRVGTDDITGRLALKSDLEDKADDHDAGMKRVSGDLYLIADAASTVGIMLYDIPAYVAQHRQYYAFAAYFIAISQTVNTDQVRWADLGRTDEPPYNDGAFRGEGKTDFYLSYANLVTSSTGQSNSNQAFNPYRDETGRRVSANQRIPGQGWWLSAQRLHARADANW
jgi:hypothetical protein